MSLDNTHQLDDIINDRYRIVGILGQGGNAITYKAEDLKNGNIVAIKAMSLSHLKDWKQLELFEREAEILKKLNHPSIPRYLDYFTVDTESDRSFYIVQDLVVGESLAQLVEKGWRTNENGVKKIAGQILEILGYLQSFNPPVIHRDIKPQNLILGTDQRVYLIDFGAVQTTYHSTLAGSSTVVGTFGYMSPEQFRGQTVPATDLYALGATLLFLLTHRSPAEIITENLKLNFRHHVQISEDFAYWLEKILEPELEKRFSSAQEALESLTNKNLIFSQLPSSKRWKNLLKIGVSVGAIMGILGYFRYPILSYLELTPIQIYTAAEKGDIQTVKYYLDQGVSASAKRTYINITPLHKAATKEIAELLINKGADVNAKDIGGFTPLHYARSPEIAQLLINHGANVNANIDVHYVKNEMNLQQPIVATAIALPSGLKFESGTPLHYTEYPEVASVLIANGADLYAKNWRGHLPIHSAAWAGKKEIVKLFLDSGVDVNIKSQTRLDNKDNSTPLIYAVYGLSWSEKDKLKKSIELVELLINRGANVNAKNADGDTALHRAVAIVSSHVNEQKELIKLLINHGADVNARNNKGETPLSLAKKSGYQDMINLLKSSGTNE